MKDLSKWIVYGGVFLIPFIPLFISNSLFFPFITGKNFAFRILVEIVFAAWIVLACYESQYRPKFSWILGSFGALLVVMFFANIFGEYPLQSFWSNFERMEGYVTLVHTFLYMLVLGSVCSTQKIWSRYFGTIVGVAVVLSFYAFAQLSGEIVINQGGWRLDGTLGNSAYMAIYMLFLIFITFFMLLRTTSTGMRYVYGFLSLLFIFLLLQTATRGTFLGLVGGSLVMVTYIALFAKEHPRLRKSAAVSIVAIIAVVAMFITYKESNFVQGNPYLQRIANISLKEAGNRFNIWSMAFQGVKERPLLGWGQGNYNYVFNKYYKPELHGGEAWFDRVHNIAMDWLIAGGIIGTIAYFSILISAVYYLFLRPLLKNDETFTVVERGLLLGLLAGYTIHNLVVFDNIVSYIFYGTILAFIHSRVGTGMAALETKKADNSIIEQIVTPVTAVVLALVIYFVNVPGIRAAGDIIDAFRATDPEVMLSSFDRALAHNSFGSQEIREQMTQRVQSVLANKDVSAEIKGRAAKRIEEELLKQIAEKPGDARVHVFIASFYRMNGKLDLATEQLAIARSLSPNKQLIILEQGIAELQKEDFPKAMEFFKQAYDLGSQFNDVRTYYAIGAVYNNRPEIVDELLVTQDQKVYFALNDLATQAVYRAKWYPRLIEMFKIQVEQNPSDQQLRANLAYVLHESGDTQGAIDVLTKAGEDIPSFKAQAEQFIASLVGEVAKGAPGVKQKVTGPQPVAPKKP